MNLYVHERELAAGIRTIVGCVVMAEFLGYGLHRLMHSGRFPALSRAHMIHHLKLYGPNQPMRQCDYQDATDGRAALGNIGMEWVIPSAAILTAIWGLLYAVGMGWPHRVLAMVVLIGWPLLMFSYIHDGMHVTGFWMGRVPLVRWWYLRARRMHDIHHRALNDEGRMDRNFGIGFFVFDRVFQTMARKHCPFNWRGYRKALRQQAELLGEDALENFPSGYRVRGPEESPKS